MSSLSIHLLLLLLPLAALHQRVLCSAETNVCRGERLGTLAGPGQRTLAGGRALALNTPRTMQTSTASSSSTSPTIFSAFYEDSVAA